MDILIIYIKPHYTCGIALMIITYDSLEFSLKCFSLYYYVRMSAFNPSLAFNH